jgi:uncharacterized protein (TIGR02145 family)
MNRFFTIVMMLFSILAGVTGQTWEWKNPLPQGNRINDVHAFDFNNAVAVGSHGTVMQTADAGLSWSVTNLENYNYIYDAHFYGTNVGYLAMGGGDVMVTTDGGNNWTSVTRPSSTNDITGVWALNATDVVCISYNGGIYKSTNNGDTWTLLTNPGSGATYLNKVYFLDASTGFIVGGNIAYDRSEIFKTTDGGNSWSLISSPVSNELKDIVFVNATTGFIVGRSGTLLNTTDGGNNWSIYWNSGPAYSEYTSGAIYSHLNTVHFIDESKGVIGGEGYVYYTTDGGANWNQGNYNYDLNVLTFFQNGAGNLIGLGDNGMMLSSSNSGASWSLPANVTYDIFRDISFMGNTGFAVSDHSTNGYVFKSNDGGASWMPLHGNGRYQSVEAVTENLIVVANNKSIEVSTDGGVNWTSNFTASGTIYDIVVGDQSVLYGVGYGVVVKSTDGGANWTELTSPTSNALTAGWFLDGSNGFVVSGSYGNGEVFKTTDGGANWNAITIPVTNLSLNDIIFTSATDGYICGQDKLLWKTTDGGSNWTSIDVNVDWSTVTDDFKAIAFADAQNGMLVGYGGFIVVTENGGDTWTLMEPRSTNQFLNAVAFSNDNIVIAGNGGAVLTYPYSSGSAGETVTDIDGNIYDVVTIGNQKWMAENIKVTQLNDGTPILNNEGAAWTTETNPAYCWYNDDISYKDLYGALYNWHTVNTNKLCPEGWHVPTRDEWDALETYLDPEGTDAVAGAKMKSTRTDPDAHPRWDSPNEGATNESGFSALPGGYRAVSSGFDWLGNHGRWWTSSESETDPSKATYRNIYYNLVRFGESNLTKELGFSVRCIQGASAGTTAPIVSTTEVSNIATTSATSGGNVTSDGGDAVSVRGVVWSKSENPTVDSYEGISTNGSGIGAFPSNLAGLTTGTTYYVRAYAANSVGVGYGNQLMFTTLSETGGGDILMQNGAVNVSTGVFYDAGGAEGNYASNSDLIFTLNPAEPGKMVKLFFSMFDLETNETCSWDYFQIYDGENTSALLIGTYCGNNSPGEITSTHSSGALTIVFHSDNSYQYSGWKANISLVTGIPDGGTINETEPNDQYTTADSFPINGEANGSVGVDSDGIDWYSFTIPYDGQIAFSGIPENTLDIVFNLYDSNGTTFIRGCDVCGSTGENETLVYENLAAGTYYLQVNDWGSTYGSYTLENVFTVPAQEEIPVVSTTIVTSITTSYAVSGGNVTSDGGANVTARGIVWSTGVSPAIDSNSGMTVDGSGIGEFTSNITGLLAETTYYGRAYATNSVGTAYGTQVEFTTSTETGGEDQEISLGDGVATDKYLPVAPFWGYSYAQTIYKQSEINVQGQITEISYYYNGNTAWTDAIDIYMGTTDKSFFTSNTDWVSVNNMTVVYSGSLSVSTTEGWVTITLDTPFDYNNTQNLVVAVDENTDGYHSISDDFYCTELPGEARSLASVSDYDNPDPANPPAGEDFSEWNPDFMPNTKFLISTGGTGGAETTVTDRDGNIYETVEIGQQVWMSANLRVTQFNDGTPIDNEIDNIQWGERFAEPLWSHYNNDPSHDAVYGKLYNGSVVTNSKNVCPEGWNIPTKEDWENLISYLGGSEVAGGKLKETGTDHWASPNQDATNTSGLTALPGGMRDGFGDFSQLGNHGLYWSSTPIDGVSSDYYTYAQYLNFNWGNAVIDDYSNDRGFSVRCLKGVGTSVPDIERSVEVLDYYLLENTLYLKDVEDKALVSVVDISGRVVYLNNIKSTGDSDVMITTLKPGIYVVSVIENNVIKRVKIVVNP